MKTLAKKRLTCAWMVAAWLAAGGVLGDETILEQAETAVGSTGAIQPLLESVSAWPGFPQAQTPARAPTANTATVATKVRTWDAEAATPDATQVTPIDDNGPVQPIVRFIPLEVALDNSTLAFSSEGVAEWIGYSWESHDGEDSAWCTSMEASGTNYWAKTSLKTRVPGPGRLSFWWKGGGAYGSLCLYVDGALRHSIPLTNGVWEEVRCLFPDTSEHEADWVLQRYNDSSPYYNATGWVDQVTWSPGDFVTLDRQNGSSATTLMAVRGEGMPTLSGVPTRPGYVFGGYFSGLNGEGTCYYTSSGASARTWNGTGNATLYAKWIPRTYTITLDGQNGTGGTESVAATYGSGMPPITVPTRAGYDFGGYYTGTNGTGTVYYSAFGQSARPWNATSNTTLYANWLEPTEVAWEYRIEGGKAVVTGASPAVGKMAVPAELGGCPVTGIGAYAFSECEELVAMSIPEGVTNIAFCAFENCSRLDSLALPDSLTGIGSRAFRNCASLGSVRIPRGVAQIEAKTFQGCSNLTAAAISEGVVSIGTDAFGQCGRLENLVFPQSLTSIGYQAFHNCDALTSVTIPDNVTCLDYSAFGYCPNLATVKLGKNVRTIGPRAFHCCFKLMPMDIPDSVTSIGASAFWQCYALTSLVIPDSVTSFGSSVFWDCTRMKRLEVPGAWWGTDNVARSEVPSGCEVVYRGIEPLAVVTEALPTGMAGTAYHATLTATGGIAPYTWSEAVGAHAETQEAGSYSETGTAKVWQADDSCWDLALPFAFPYFGHSYTNAKVNSNGAISFGANRFTAYAYSEGTFNGAPIIAALWKDLSTADGDIFVTSGTDAVTVRWSGTYYNGGAVNFSATLHRSGKIVLSYGAGNAGGGTIGLSAGNGMTTVFSAKSNGGSMENADDIVFTPGEWGLPWLELSADGTLTGTPPAVGEYRVPVTATDSKGVTAVGEFTFAVLEPKQVTTFKGNGGTPVSQKTTNEVGTAYGTMPMPKQAGHAFLGWFTEATGGVKVTEDDKVTPEAARTLYAHWTNRQVTTFKGNGGMPSVQTKTNTIYNYYVGFPEAKWSRHALVGWFTAPEGGERVYTNSTVTLAAERTLYAHWTTEQVTTFQANGGSPAVQATTNTIYADYGAFPEAKWSGHALVGWFNAPEGGKRIYTNSTVTLAATRTLYAQWTTNQVTTFKGNGGTPEIQKTTNAIYTHYGTLPGAAWENHAFLGWFNHPTKGKRVYTNSTVTLAAARTLYAHWTDRQVVTFKGNGGSPDAVKATNTMGTAYGTLPTPKKSGYAFLGWFTKAAGGSKVTAEDMVTVASTRTLYAHWTDQQVTTFLGNGGRPETQATTNTIYGKYATMPTPKWSGHVFLGWFNAQEGGKRVYTNSTVTLAAARMLWAQWTDQQVTTFKGNGGTPETQATTNTIYAKYTYLPTPAWEGHTFQGWYNAKEGGKRVYTNSIVTLASTRTLYAHWTTAKGFAITAIAVGADGGDEGPSPRVVRDSENEENVCRLRFELSQETEYEIQWTASLASEWETVERLTAETDGEVVVELEVPGEEKGFFRVVAFGDAGEAD